MKSLVIKTPIILLLTVFAFLGCENQFEEINTDPNALDNPPTHYFLPTAISSLVKAENNSFDGYFYPSLWVQYTTRGDWDQPRRYYYEPGRSALWRGVYRGPLSDLDFMISKAVEEENASLEAVGKILHAYGFTLLVNAFGDIPYTESFKVDEGINQPVYDAQSDVFDAILENLREANTMLSGVSEINIPSPEKFDLLYSGDALKWRKFANSLRFRLLIQLSNIRDVKTEIAAISPMFESSADNAEYTFSGAIRDVFPLISVAPEDAGAASIHRLAEPLVDRMLETNDPRLFKYALPNEDGEYIGAGIDDQFAKGNDFAPINPINFPKTATVPFMNYNELLFLKAEAAQKGLISGDAVSLLGAAVTANMLSFGVSNSEISPFVDALTVNGTDLNEIYTEKWVSMFRRGMQSWVDYRRTGVPALTPNRNGRVNVIPRRFSYPDGEHNNNEVNVKAAAQKLSNGDELDSELIWTVN